MHETAKILNSCKMTNVFFCRTCLLSSNKLHDVRNTQLQEIFEKLTGKKLNKEYGSTALCYICYAQLQRCRKFAEMSLETEAVLREYVNKDIEITLMSISQLKRKTTLSTTPVSYFYNGSNKTPIEDNPIFRENQLILKDEKNDEGGCSTEVPFAEVVVIKEELTLVEDEIVIKDENEEEIWLEEIDIENEVTVNYNFESVIKTEELELCEDEYVDTEGLSINIKENVLPYDTLIKDQSLNFDSINCNKTYNTDRKLKKCRRIHAKHNTYICDTCNKTFTTKNAIIRHLTTHTKKTCICKLCDKPFAQERYLKEHIRTHTGEKPYTCEKCDKRFTDKSTLNRHLRNHTGEKRFGEKRHKCSQCHKKFFQKSHLQIHMNIHSGYKPYTCHVCNHSFNQKCSLKPHMRIHTGEKTHSCDICHKEFYRKGHLTQHMSVHTGDRPFGCNLCNKYYSTVRGLAQHSCKVRKNRNVPTTYENKGGIYLSCTTEK